MPTADGFDTIAEQFGAFIGRILVRGRGAQASVEQPVHQSISVVGEFQRRIGMNRHAVRLLIIFTGEVQIVMQGLTVYGLSGLACFGNGAHAFLGRSMDEIHPGAGVLGQTNDRTKSQVFGQIVVDEMHIIGLVASLALKLLKHIIHDLVLFRVDGHHAAVFGHFGKNLPQMSVRDTHLRGGKNLEAAHALL